MSINHVQLRAFHAVAAEGSFTRAAEALRVTQPIELGKALLEVTRRLFSAEDEAEQLLAAARGLTRGHLRIGADAPYSIVPVIAEFNRLFDAHRPRLVLSLRTGVRQAVAGLGVGIVAKTEFGHDSRVRALEVIDAELTSTEYVVCLAERRSLRIVSAFLELVEQAARL